MFCENEILRVISCMKVKAWDVRCDVKSIINKTYKHSFVENLVNVTLENSDIM